MAKTRFQAFGEWKTIAQWAVDKRCVVTKDVLERRFHGRKWDLEAALTTTQSWVKRESVEADRKKPAVRTFVPEPVPQAKRRKRKHKSGQIVLVRPQGQEAEGWRSTPTVIPAKEVGTPRCEVSSGLPSLGRRR